MTDNNEKWAPKPDKPDAQIDRHGPPPGLEWVCAIDLPAVAGEPVAICLPGEIMYDHRAVSNPHEGETPGSWWVDVVHEADWWKWVDTPNRPRRVPGIKRVRAIHLWVAPRLQYPRD